MKVIYCVAALFFLFSVPAAAQQLNTPISRIQGSENISPIVGQRVSTRGIVTAIVDRGFFIQTPDGDVDSDPATSEGLYVFTADEKIEDLAVGHAVQVDGTVGEFKPRSDRYSLPVTQISRATIRVLSKNQQLPAPILLDASFFNPQGLTDQLERFEGMRVKVDVVTVVAPTGGRTDETTHDTKSNGLFAGVFPGVPRPFREPGLDVLAAAIEKYPPTVPTFDMNPELVRIDSDAQQGSKAIDVAVGSTVKNIIGVVDNSFRNYTILLDPGIATFTEINKRYIPAGAAKEREVSIGSFNLENFFDDEKNSPNVAQEAIVPAAAFQRKLKKASLAIRNGLSMPDVLGVIEVENITVLKKLAAKMNLDVVSMDKPDPKYEAFLEEGNDIRGIDVGFLVKTSKFKVLGTEQLGKDVPMVHKDARPNEKLHDRPPFLIRVEAIDLANPNPLKLTIIVNHFKSYGGIEDEKIGDLVRQKKRQQAEWLANFIQERAKTFPDEKLIICGDLNAFQFNDGYNDVIGTLTGKSDMNVLVPPSQTLQNGLDDLIRTLDPPKQYSYVFGGSAQVLDHILVNEPAWKRSLRFTYARLNADFPDILRNDDTRPERVSDHDAPMLYLALDETKLGTTN